MGAATHVTPARLHGHQPASCHASSTLSQVHMSARVLRPTAAWATFWAPQIAWYKAGSLLRPWKK
eukprot:1160217-Pelagomonas_calceolata.AAC.18